MQQRVAWGTAAAVFYLVVSTLGSRHAPVRLLYDGDAPPPPYHWVHPPENVPGPNDPPELGGGSITLTTAGSQTAVIVTGDVQAVVVFAKDAVAPRRGEFLAHVSITPLDPPPSSPLRGFRFDGNAYRIEAVYSASGQPVVLRHPVTVVLRYPIHATHIVRNAESRWVALPTRLIGASLQLFATTDRLGVFVAAAQ